MDSVERSDERSIIRNAAKIRNKNYMRLELESDRKQAQNQRETAST